MKSLSQTALNLDSKSLANASVEYLPVSQRIVDELTRGGQTELSELGMLAVVDNLVRDIAGKSQIDARILAIKFAAVINSGISLPSGEMAKPMANKEDLSRLRDGLSRALGLDGDPLYQTMWAHAFDGVTSELEIDGENISGIVMDEAEIEELRLIERRKAEGAATVAEVAEEDEEDEEEDDDDDGGSSFDPDEYLDRLLDDMEEFAAGVSSFAPQDAEPSRAEVLQTRIAELESQLENMQKRPGFLSRIFKVRKD